MTGFWYNYTSIEDIFANITTLANFSLPEYILLWFMILCLFGIVYIAFPTLFVIYSYRLKEKDKVKRKKLLTQITLQKEIEDEIEQEIHMKEQEKISQTA